MNEQVISPKDILLPYQLNWVNDPARFKIGLMSRQVGKSFACAAEAVEDCLLHPAACWVVLSAGERQSIEFMEKAKQWAAAYKLAIEDYIEERDSAEALIKSAEIKWGNKSRMIALPANPATARGYTAHLILDEFGHHEKPDAIWRAIFPSISNPLKGQLKLRIVSTANGKANKFYDLWTKNTNYSRHKVTIYDAVKQGLPVNVEELKAGLDDPEGWAQEYECEFIDDTSVLLPYDLIAACESADAVETEPIGARLENPLYFGVDIGRKHDLTVAWTLEKIGDVLWTREILVMEKTPFHLQLAALLPRARRSVRSAVDATGIGAMLAEELARALGEKIEQCVFTADFKNEIYTGLRRSFEDKLIRVPVSRAVREDLHGLQKVSTTSGAIRYVAPSNEDGHCDRATALALARRAAANTNIPGNIMIFENTRRGRAIAARRERSCIA